MNRFSQWKPIVFFSSLFLLIPWGCALRASPHVSRSPFDFRVGGLNQYATLYCPKEPSGSAPGARPMVILLHGGFWGDDAATHSLGQKLAEEGFCAIAPTYRGEKRKLDGKKSDGEIEFCAGEVEDTMALMDQIRQKPRFHNESFALVGFSHGGCIALRVAEKRKDIRSVVVFSGPVDAASLHEFLSKNWEKNFFFNGWLAGKLRKWAEGAPEENPKAWRERSPLFSLQSLQAPLLFIHGLQDNMVPVEQTYRFRDQMRKKLGRTISEKRFSPRGRLVSEKSLEGANPGLAPAEFLFFEKQGHSFSRATHEIAERLAIEFLVRHAGD